MGVRGLTTFIAKRSDVYMQSYELSDTYLVVDGNSITCQLYNYTVESYSAFGGDYDEFYKVVYSFFETLNKCGVKPIVIFDGGYEKRKVPTVVKRRKEKFFFLKTHFGSSFSKVKFFPLFLSQIFRDVLDEMGIICFQSNFEADNEIAALGRALNCPVLSYDSDFFIYNVLYIPFSTVSLKAVKRSETKFFMKCSIYDVDNFLKEFKGLNKSMLPILAVLLGNDYVESSMFHNFFNHVSLPKGKNWTPSERRVHAVLHWLRNETFESAIPHIISHLKKDCERFFMKALNSTVKCYTDKPTCLGSVLKISEIQSINEDNAIPILQNLPPYFVKNFQMCKILPNVYDIVTLGTYFLPIVIQDVKRSSPHEVSYPLINVIHGFLTAIAKKTLKLKLHSPISGRLQYFVIAENISDYITEVAKLDLEISSTFILQEKRRVIYEVVGVAEHEVESILDLPENWILYLLAFIYFLKNLKPSLMEEHFHSLLLCMILEQIIQSKADHCKSLSKLMKDKHKIKQKLKQNENCIVNDNEENISKLLPTACSCEWVSLIETSYPFHQANEMVTGKAYSVSAIHDFNSFQSCLYHIMQLNAILNFPFKNPKVSELYCGTFIYNLYVKLKRAPDCIAFINKLLKSAPKTLHIYNILCESLSTYKPVKNLTIKIKKRSKKKTIKKVSTEIHYEPYLLVDIEEYHDENNPYSILQKV